MRLFSLTFVLVFYGISGATELTGRELLVARFHANFQATRVGVDFEFRKGTVDSALVNHSNVWEIATVEFTNEMANEYVRGSWDTDGVVERYANRPKDELTAKALEDFKGHPRKRHTLDFVMPFELLRNSEMEVYHPLHSDAHISFVKREESPTRFLLCGPYDWGFGRFPESVLKSRPNTKWKVSEGSWGGHVVSNLVGEIGRPGGNCLVQVGFDSTIGYLPRYARVILPISDGTTHVRELIMVDARKTEQGGFVPTNWLETEFRIASFSERYPKFNQDTIVAAQRETVLASQYIVTTVREQPVLKFGSNINAFLTQSGFVKVSERDRDNLTLETIQRIVGD